MLNNSAISEQAESHHGTVQGGRVLLHQALVICSSFVLMISSCALPVTAPERVSPAVNQSPLAPSQRPGLRLVESEVVSLLYFAASLSGRSPWPSTRLNAIYEEHKGPSELRQRLGDIFGRLPGAFPLYSETLPSPEGDRPRTRRFIEVLEVLAMETSDLEQFEAASAALLPAPEHIRLIKALKELRPLHSRYIWEPHRLRLSKAKKAMMGLADQVDLEDITTRIAAFYGSDVPADQEIVLALVPIPGEARTSRGHSIGHHGVLEIIEEDAFGPRFEVMVHELCHSFYSAQPRHLQQSIASDLKGSDVAEAPVASQLLNEAVATAIGNGWVGAKWRDGGLKATHVWYNDEAIDAFAKAIYPEVKHRLDSGGTWDSTATHHFIAKLAETMPDAHLMPRFVFRKSLFILDTERPLEDVKQWSEALEGLEQRYDSSPAKHPFSIQAYRKDAVDYTPVFVLGRGDGLNLSEYPFYAEWGDTLTEALASGVPFYFAAKDGENGRLHVFLGVQGANRIKPVLQQLHPLRALRLDQVVPLIASPEL